MTRRDGAVSRRAHSQRLALCATFFRVDFMLQISHFFLNHSFLMLLLLFIYTILTKKIFLIFLIFFFKKKIIILFQMQCLQLPKTTRIWRVGSARGTMQEDDESEFVALHNDSNAAKLLTSI